MCSLVLVCCSNARGTHRTGFIGDHTDQPSGRSVRIGICPCARGVFCDVLRRHVLGTVLLHAQRFVCTRCGLTPCSAGDARRSDATHRAGSGSGDHRCGRSPHTIPPNARWRVWCMHRQTASHRVCRELCRTKCGHDRSALRSDELGASALRPGGGFPATPRSWPYYRTVMTIDLLRDQTPIPPQCVLTRSMLSQYARSTNQSRHSIRFGRAQPRRECRLWLVCLRVSQPRPEIILTRRGFSVDVRWLWMTTPSAPSICTAFAREESVLLHRVDTYGGDSGAPITTGTTRRCLHRGNRGDSRRLHYTQHADLYVGALILTSTLQMICSVICQDTPNCTILTHMTPLRQMSSSMGVGTTGPKSS